MTVTISEETITHWHPNYRYSVHCFIKLMRFSIKIKGPFFDPCVSGPRTRNWKPCRTIATRLSFSPVMRGTLLLSGVVGGPVLKHGLCAGVWRTSSQSSGWMLRRRHWKIYLFSVFKITASVTFHCYRLEWSRHWELFSTASPCQI